MRILVYSINYAPEPTSTGKYAGEMAAWLASRGHSVHAIAPPPHYPQWRVDEQYQRAKGQGPRAKGCCGYHTQMLDGVQVFRCPLYIPPPDRITAKTRILYETSFCAAAARHFLPLCLPAGSARPYDVVIAICPPVQLGLWPWLVHLTRRIPWVFHIQDLQVDTAVRLGMLPNRSITQLMRGIEGFLLRRAALVSTITEPMRRRIIERGVGEKRTLLVPNWANLDAVTPGETHNAFRREHGFARDELIFMYAGNLGIKQGMEVLLHAAHQLRDDKRLRFVIVGCGAAQNKLEQQIAELQLTNVTLLAVQPFEKLSDMLAAADVHLVIQRSQAADLVMPSKLTNILAAGRPAIATAEAHTALGSVINEQEVGLICEPDNPEALAAAIKQLALDPAARKQMGYNARCYAENHLNQDTILTRFENALTDL